LTEAEKKKVYESHFKHFVPRVKVGHISGQTANEIISKSEPESRPKWKQNTELNEWYKKTGTASGATPALNVDIAQAHNQFGIKGTHLTKLNEEIKNNGGVKIHKWESSPHLG
jgi:hypothetical protein